MRPRDSQRSRVYRWEDSVFPIHAKRSTKYPRLSLQEIESLCRKYVPAHWQFEIKDGRGTRKAMGWRYKTGESGVSLPRWARRLPTVLHELAHALTPRSHAAHGPEWTRVYINLLALEGCGSLRALETSAAASRVRIAPF